MASDADAYAQIPDEPLLRLVANGDKDAFAMLHWRYRPQLYKYLVKVTGGEHRVEELVHEAFAAAWRAAGRFDGRIKVSAWLFAIAHDKALDTMPEAREAGAGAAIDDGAEAPVGDPEDTAAEPPEPPGSPGPDDAMRICIGRLAADHRAVVELTYYQAMPVGEIAAVVDCPEDVVTARMFDAHANIAACLKGLNINWRAHQGHAHHPG